VQANGLFGAGVDASHAENGVLGEATIIECKLQMPGRFLRSIESTGVAGVDTVVAKSAFAL
jgi:hypothetical protein